MTRQTAPGTRWTFAYITMLFFIWGAVTSVNDILIPAVKAIFSLSDTESFLTQFAFFLAYGVVSLPAAAIMGRLGAANSIILALATMIAGCLIMPFATIVRAYPIVLVGLFVIASGITLLQVAANPLSASLGRPERSHFRLVLSQAFNSLGMVIAPYLAARTLLQGGLFDEGPVTEAKIAYSLGRIDVAYVFIALLIAVLALVIWRVRHEITAAAPPPEVGTKVSSAFSSRWALAGALSIFLYVGAEVAIGTKAPPTIAMHSNPDVADCGALERAIVSEKITGNMIELNSPTEIASTPATGPVIWLIVRHSAAAANAAPASSGPAGSLNSKPDPMNRPTIAPSQ